MIPLEMNTRATATETNSARRLLRKTHAWVHKGDDKLMLKMVCHCTLRTCSRASAVAKMNANQMGQSHSA